MAAGQKATAPTGTAEGAAKRERIRSEHPDSWVAVNEGDLITGTVRAVDDAWSDVRNNVGGFYPLLTVEVDEATGYPAPPDGPAELKIHAFSSVLYSEVMKHRPEIGERITFTYVGESKKEPPKGRNRPQIYRLQVHGRRDAAGRAYDRIAGTERPAGADQPESDIPWEG